MCTRDHAFIPGYNAQAAVDAESQIIVAADLTNQAADSPHLPDMVAQIRANTGRVPAELSADAGYYSAANLTVLAVAGIAALIPPERIRHSAWRQARPPRGRIPRHATPKDRMRRNLRTKRGRARYQLRQETVEPVFGQIKGNRGLRQVLVRGLDPVRHWWRFACAVHNLLKMRTAGVTFT